MVLSVEGGIFELTVTPFSLVVFGRPEHPFHKLKMWIFMEFWNNKNI